MNEIMFLRSQSWDVMAPRFESESLFLFFLKQYVSIYVHILCATIVI